MCNGVDKTLPELSADDLASTRLRLAVAGHAAVESGSTLSAGDHMPKHADVVLVGKIPIFDYDRRASGWLRQLNECKSNGGRIVIDYTDHHLGFDSPVKPFYLSALPLADSCIVPHHALAEALMTVQPALSSKIRVIEDLIEYPFRDPRQSAQNGSTGGVLWFGHGTNFEFLARLCTMWPEGAPRDLFIVSSEEVHNFIRSGQLTASVELDVHFRLWSQQALQEVAATASLAVIPSSFESRKQFASSNRLVTSLALGLPVVATPLPSYLEFAEHFCELGSDAANEFFTDPQQALPKVLSFQHQYAERFSVEKIANDWCTAINES